MTDIVTTVVTIVVRTIATRHGITDIVTTVVTRVVTIILTTVATDNRITTHAIFFVTDGGYRAPFFF